MPFDAGSIESHLTVDRSEFNRELDGAKADADRFTRDPIKAKITADGADARAVMDDLSARKDKLRGDIGFKVKADAAEANADLDKLAAKKAAVGKDETIKVKTETDTSGLDKLGQKVTELKDGPFGLLKTAIVGLGPAAVPVLGGITAAIAPLTAAIGSAAIGMGAFGEISKLVLTQAGTASTAVQKAQTAYNAAIDAGTKKATAYATEQKAIAVAYSGMSAQQVALSKQVGDLTASYKGMLGSVTPLVSSALVPWMKDVQQLLQYIKPLIAPIATDFQAWGTELGKTLSANQGKLQNFFALFGARSAGNIASLGSALISFAKGAGSLIHDVAPGLAGAANGVAGLAASFAKWAGSKQAADDIRSFFAWAKSAAPEVKQFLGALAGSLGTLIKAASYSGGGDLRVLTTALQAISALPAGAVVALADGYVAISLGLRAASAAMATWNAISTVAKGIQAALSDEIEVTGAALVVQKIAALAMAAADAVVDAAETIYIGLMLAADAASLPLIVVIGAIVAAVAALAFGIYELVTHWTAVWHAILSAAQAVFGWIKANWPLLVGILGGPIGVAIALIATHWQTALSDAKKIWNAIASFFSGWWDTEVSAWKSTLSTVTGLFSSAWDTVTSGVKSAWNAIKSFFSGWWNAEVSGWKNTISTVTGLFRSAWNTVSSDARQIWNAIKSWFSGWWSDEVTGWRNTISTVTGIFRAGWNTVESDAKRIFNSVMSFFKTFWGDLKTGFSSAVNGVKSAWDKIESIVRTPINWVVQNVYDKLIVPFWNATGAKVGLGSLKRLAAGGRLPGYGGGDQWPALLESGETVVSKESSQLPWMRAAFEAAGVPGYAAGGTAGYSGSPGTSDKGFFSDVWDDARHLGGSIGHDILSLLSGAVHDLRSLLKLPLEAVERGIDAIISHVPGTGGMATYAKDAARKIVAGLITEVEGATQPTGTGTSIHTNTPGTVVDWITQALKDASKPMSWLPDMETIAWYESGDNPNAINLSDCVTLDYVILTKRGWLAHDEVQPGDETIGYNPETGRSEWTPITRVVRYDDAEVWRIGNNHWHADVTPNHRWWSDTLAVVQPAHETCPECGWVPRGGKMPARGVQVHRAKIHGIKSVRAARETLRGEFVRTDGLRAGQRLRVAAPADTDGIPGLSLEDVRIIAWLQGDGTVTPYTVKPQVCPECGWKPGDFRGRIGDQLANAVAVHRAKKHGMTKALTQGAFGGYDGRIWQSKPGQIIKLRALLAHLNAGESVRERGGNRMPSHVFRLPREYVTDLMKRSQVMQTGPEAFVRALSPDQRAAWLDSMIDAEGNRQPVAVNARKRRGGSGEFVRIAQINGPLQEAIKLAVYLEGYRPTFSSLSAEKNGFKPSGQVGMARPHVVPSMFNPHEVLERQPVWCVTTELGTWTARGGDALPFLTGNSNAAAGDPSRGLLAFSDHSHNV